MLGPCLVPLGSARDELLAEWAGRLADDACLLGAERRSPFAPFAAKLRRDLLAVGSDIMPTLLRECTEHAVRVQLNKDKRWRTARSTASTCRRRRSWRPRCCFAERRTRRRYRADLAGLLDGQLLQVGGDETLGKGLVWGRLLGGAGR